MSKIRQTRNAHLRELAKVRIDFAAELDKWTTDKLARLVLPLLRWSLDVGSSKEDDLENAPDFPDELLNAFGISKDDVLDLLDDSAPLAMLLFTRRVDAGEAIEKELAQWLSIAFKHALKGNPLNTALPCRWDPFEEKSDLDRRDFFMALRVKRLIHEGKPVQTAKDFVAHDYKVSSKTVEVAWLTWKDRLKDS